MTNFIALLRAVNLPSHGKVAMSDLRDLATELGLADARTLIQSGNLVFSDGRKSGELERLLETEAEKRLGLRTDFHVRSAAEWKALIAHNPFPDEAERDPGHLIVMCLKDAPESKDVEALQAAIKGRETVRAHGRQAYLVYPDGSGRSKLTNALIEKKLRTRGTGRNWNTVLKLAALAPS
jgi:uncharacterized protein (DUF1697 family)